MLLAPQLDLDDQNRLMIESTTSILTMNSLGNYSRACTSTPALARSVATNSEGCRAETPFERVFVGWVCRVAIPYARRTGVLMVVCIDAGVPQAYSLEPWAVGMDFRKTASGVDSSGGD